MRGLALGLGKEGAPGPLGLGRLLGDVMGSEMKFEALVPGTSTL
jgi:hypothetical protein